MAAEVLTRAWETALITRAEVKKRLQGDEIAVDDSHDEFLDFLIADATSDVETYLDRPLCRQQYRERVAILGGQIQVTLSRRPVEPDRPSGHLSVLRDGAPAEGWAVDNAEAGILCQTEIGWGSTADSLAWGRSSPWGRSSGPVASFLRDYSLDVAAPQWTVIYWAGYVLPGQVTDWEGGSDCDLGSWVRLPGQTLLLECTRAGNTGLAPPAALTAGEQVEDGTAQWTPWPARELPSTVVRAAYEAVKDSFRKRGATGDAASLSTPSLAVRFRQPRPRDKVNLPQAAIDRLEALR